MARNLTVDEVHLQVLDTDEDYIFSGSDDDLDAEYLEEEEIEEWDEERMGNEMNEAGDNEMNEADESEEEYNDDEDNGDNEDGDEDNGSRVRQKNRKKKEKQEKIKWSSNEQDVIISPFTGEPGPKVTISSNPSEIFLTFFTTALLDLIVTETNRYASKCLKHDDWQTSREEILAYFGFCILMAMNKVPDLYDYWSTDMNMHYAAVASRITRKRFMEIKSFLHFVDIDQQPCRTDPNFDRLGRVRPVIDIVTGNFRSVYHPGREVSVDEAMIKFKGRSSIKQYLPKKPIRRGIKSWVMADAVNGYVCDLQVYTGKHGDRVTTNLGMHVVTHLTSSLPSGSHVYFDNYFSSLPLVQQLLEHQIYCCGTFRRDRVGLPEVVRHLKECE